MQTELMHDAVAVLGAPDPIEKVPEDGASKCTSPMEGVCCLKGCIRQQHTGALRHIHGRCGYPCKTRCVTDVDLEGDTSRLLEDTPSGHKPNLAVPSFLRGEPSMEDMMFGFYLRQISNCV